MGSLTREEGALKALGLLSLEGVAKQRQQAGPSPERLGQWNYENTGGGGNALYMSMQDSRILHTSLVFIRLASFGKLGFFIG